MCPCGENRGRVRWEWGGAGGQWKWGKEAGECFCGEGRKVMREGRKW